MIMATLQAHSPQSVPVSDVFPMTPNEGNFSINGSVLSFDVRLPPPKPLMPISRRIRLPYTLLARPPISLEALLSQFYPLNAS